MEWLTDGERGKRGEGVSKLRMEDEGGARGKEASEDGGRKRRQPRGIALQSDSRNADGGMVVKDENGIAEETAVKQGWRDD